MRTIQSLRTSRVTLVSMYVFQISGLMCAATGGLRMCGMLEAYIDGKQWLILFFTGIMLCCIGFFIEAYLAPMPNYEAARQRKQSMIGMTIASVACAIVLVAVVFLVERV